MAPEPNAETAVDITIVEPPRGEDELLRMADPSADVEEIRAGMSGCVVHLCGCK